MIRNVDQGAGAAKTQTTQDAGPDKKKEGGSDFEKLMEQKSTQHQPVSTRRGEGMEGRRGKEGSIGEKLETARSTEHGVQLQKESDDSSGSGGGKDSDGQHRDDSSGSHRRAMPGDVLISSVPPPQLMEIKPVIAVRSPETVAHVQRIVDRIVEAVQVRMPPGGATEVRMELNMGNLGNMQVQLHRTAEGQIRIEFQAVSVEARNLLKESMSDLTNRLEARGIGLKEITVQSVDQPGFRWEPTSVAQADRSFAAPSQTTAAAAQGSQGSEWHGRGGSDQDQQDQRHRRDTGEEIEGTEE